MSQMHKTANPAPLVVTGIAGPRFLRAAILALLLTATLIAAAVFATRLTAPAAQPAGAQSQVVDGWMLHLPDPDAARRLTVASEVTDGWALSFLTANRAPEVTDGWAARYLKSGGNR